jgi:hypothetical protein
VPNDDDGGVHLMQYPKCSEPGLTSFRGPGTSTTKCPSLGHEMLAEIVALDTYA